MQKFIELIFNVIYYNLRENPDPGQGERKGERRKLRHFHAQVVTSGTRVLFFFRLLFARLSDFEMQASFIRESYLINRVGKKKNVCLVANQPVL